MQRYQNVAQDAQGNIIQAMNASVFLKGTQTPAALFADAAGTIPIANPQVTDPLGNFAFYAANGRYDVQLSKTNLPTSIVPDVLMFDPFGGGGGGPFVQGQVLFGGSGGALSQDPAFFWDNTNKRLGIGTGTPVASLHTTGNVQIDGNASIIGSTAADTTLKVFVRGISAGVRFGTGAGGFIEGVDQTGTGSFQPLTLNGSSLNLQNSGSTKVAIASGAMTLTSTGITQNYDSAAINPIVQNDTNAAGATWITGPGAGSGNRGDYNIYNSTASQLVLRFSKTTGAATFLSSVITTVVTSATGLSLNAATANEIDLQINGSNIVIINGNGLFPVSGGGKQLGAAANIWSSAYTTAVDSGSTGPLSLRTNSGSVGFQVVDNGATVNNIQAFGSPTGVGTSTLRASGSDTNVALALQSQGNSAINFQTNSASPALQLQIIHTASATRNITITGSAAGNPTLGVTAGSLAITPSVVIAGSNLQIGTNPSTGGVLGIPYNSPITARNQANSQNVSVANIQTINSINNLVVIGDTSQGGGAQYQGRVLAATAPTTSDIPTGFFTVWNDNTTAKLYYNLAGTLKSVALA